MNPTVLEYFKIGLLGIAVYLLDRILHFSDQFSDFHSNEVNTRAVSKTVQSGTFLVLFRYCSGTFPAGGSQP
jgi:hypothetical protein